jgi:hypothetical protein
LSWSTPFSDPIELPNGRKLVTLKDAARYIQKLPKATHDLPHWQDAVEHLMRASAGSPAWLMFARMFMLRAMNHGVERVFNPDRKDTHWGKRKLKRDE